LIKLLLIRIDHILFIKITIFVEQKIPIKLENISVERSFRYAMTEATQHTKTLVYLLHGYGQLATYFIRKTEGISRETTTFVAPEGMHRFYLQGTAGRVGASWMTKEAREIDIHENTLALDQLHEKLLKRLQPERIIVIGFSQGGATAARWIINGKIEVDTFVSWASVFPPDLTFPDDQLSMKTKKRYFVVGNADPYFDEATVEMATIAYEQLGFEVLRFEGNHDLDKQLIEQLIANK